MSDATKPPWTERDQRVIAEFKMLRIGVRARACEVQQVAPFVPSDEATITALLYELAELRVQVAELREAAAKGGP